MVMVKERRRATDRDLELALQQIERQFGKGAVQWGDAEGALVEVEAITTGSIALDRALGIGGLPRGRWVEIYGPESSGKTTIALHAIANAQKADPDCVCVFIDFEHALSKKYAVKLGVDIKRLLITQPDTGEQGFEIAEFLIRSRNVAVVVFDSTGAIAPKAEIEGEMGDSHAGLKTRLISQALRKLTKVISDTGTLGIFISQMYEKVGVMFGSPENSTGGKALKFYASVRLDVRRIETLKDGTDAVGNRTRVKVVKNKMAPPFEVAEFDIIYGVGISWAGALIDVGVEQRVVRKTGAWYIYYPEIGEEVQLGQGKQNARAFLSHEANTLIANEIEDRIREKLGLPAIERPEVETEARPRSLQTA